MNRFSGWCLPALLFILATAAAPLGAEPQKIGLALSGGGARGLAHIGVLRALEANDIAIDYIAGTSMGSVIGGLYAAGFSVDEIERVVSEIDWTEVFSDASPRKFRSQRQKELEQNQLINYRLGFNGGEVQIPLGVLQGQRLNQLLTRLVLPVLDVEDFSDLSIPFQAVATDLVSGAAVNLGSGNMVEAMRASMSVPGVFSPVEHGEMLLVDGGLSNNLPVSTVREMGADIVIAVDVSMPMYPRELLDSVLRVTEQITTLMTRVNTEQQIAGLKPDDVLIVPNLVEVGSATFELAEHAIRAGQQATEHVLVEHANYLTRRIGSRLPASAMAGFVVDFVELNNQSNLDDEILRSRLTVELGQPLDTVQLAEDLQTLYGLEIFEHVSWQPVRNAAGQRGIRVDAIPHQWGPNYLQFGLSASDDFSGNNDYSLAVAYTRTGMNRLGGELRTDMQIGVRGGLALDFYQPMDRRAQYFFNPVALYRKRELNVFEDDQKLAEIRLRETGLKLGLGRNFGTTGRLRLDYQRLEGDADVTAGAVGLPDESYSIGELQLQASQDTLDDIDFPRHGYQLMLAARAGRTGLGSDEDYEQLFGLASQAHTFGRHSIVWRVNAGYTRDDAAPLERVFELGGFGKLSGLAPNQLNGQHFGMATMAYYRRLGNVDFLPAYAGFSLEAGNVWQDDDDISFSNLRAAGSLFIGANSPLGPVYLAYGRAEGGDSSLYLFVGNPFVGN